MTKPTKTKVLLKDITDDEGVLCLKGPLFWKWRALDAEHRAAVMELEQLKGKVAAEIAKHPELAELIGLQAGAVGQVSQAKGVLLQVQTEIEALMGVSLKDCAFDDKTGRLYNLASDGQRSDPVKPPKRRSRKTT